MKNFTSDFHEEKYRIIKAKLSVYCEVEFEVTKWFEVTIFLKEFSRDKKQNILVMK